MQQHGQRFSKNYCRFSQKRRPELQTILRILTLYLLISGLLVGQQKHCGIVFFPINGTITLPRILTLPKDSCDWALGSAACPKRSHHLYTSLYWHFAEGGGKALEYCVLDRFDAGHYWSSAWKIAPRKGFVPLSLPICKIVSIQENDKYLKLLWRLGTDTDNTIIIDRDESNFKYDRDIGIALPWHGRRKDNKLLELLGQLHNFLVDDTQLRKVFPLIKQNIQGKKHFRRASDHQEDT